MLSTTKLEWSFYDDPLKSWADPCPLDHWPYQYGYQIEGFLKANLMEKESSFYL